MSRVPSARRVRVTVIRLFSLDATLVVVAPVALGAATRTVDTFEDTFDGSCDDGDCSLRDAVAAVDAGGRSGCRRGSIHSRSPGPDQGRATSTSDAT